MEFGLPLALQTNASPFVAFANTSVSLIVPKCDYLIFCLVLVKFVPLFTLYNKALNVH